MKLIQFGTRNQEYYKESLVRAANGLHLSIANIIKNKIPKGSKILDLGAGQGALSHRLIDLGYNILSVDINIDDYKLDKKYFYQVNFNSSKELDNFKSRYKDSFDAVIGIEVIEHIENPWEYIRLIKHLIKPGGCIIVSTPNISSWLSRMYFLFTGKFFHFDDSDFINSGHISPISFWEIKNILKAEEFQNIEIKPASEFPIFWITKNIKLYIYYLVGFIFRLFMINNSKGDCIIVIAKKN